MPPLSSMRFLAPSFALCVALIATAAPSLQAQMKAGDKMKNYEEVFGLSLKDRFPAYDVTLVESKPTGNVLAPGQQPEFTFLLTNLRDEPIRTSGKIDVLAYGTKGIPGDIWLPEMFKSADLASLPIAVDLKAKGSQLVTVRPELPAAFGAYALIADLGSAGRRFATSCVRTFAPVPEKIQYPKLALDDAVGPDVLKGLGVQAIRLEVGYFPPGSKEKAAELERVNTLLRACAERNITVMLMFMSGASPQPLGRGRPHLDDDGVMLKTKQDLAWLPEYDADFRAYVASLCGKYGWPKGAVTSVLLWNEPWDGISISGWGADSIRYREMFTAMAEGVEEARSGGAQILIGGCDSSTNTLDKLFADGKDTYLKWLDVCTIHYQGLTAPVLFRNWLNRKGPNGRVRVWDTESWVANTDDRVAVIVAADRAAGYDRAMGVFCGNVSTENRKKVKLPDGSEKEIDTFHVWSPAVAVGAAQHFLGERDFRELLFKNGLPWVMTFDGLKGNADDGTVVVVGDLTEEFGDQLLFRGVRGLAEAKKKDPAELKRQLDLLPPDSPERWTARKKWMAREPLSGGQLVLADPAGEFVLFDFYGNPVPAQGGTIKVPLDNRGFFLRTNGAAGSFARLTDAIAKGRIEGYQPVEIVAHDLLGPVGAKGTALRLTLTNILNRPVRAKLKATLGELKLDVPSEVALDGHETKDVLIPVSTSNQPRPDNVYALSARIDAGADGAAALDENLHVNRIAKRTIKVDGSLDDWEGVLPETVRARGDQGPSLMEAAWLPFAKYDAAQKSGVATGFLAYDDANFYFAAKIADDTPSPGTLRFEKRDDDSYFYPPVSYEYDEAKTLLKQETVWSAPSRAGGALFLPGSEAKRSFTAWTGVAQSFAVDLSLPEGQYRKVSFYFVDWDEYQEGRRRVAVEVHDASSEKGDKILATTMVGQYGQGNYASFLISGKVRVVFRGQNTFGATLSGIFFDAVEGGKKPPQPTFARFLAADLKTGARWQGTYGGDGYQVLGAAPKLPADVALSIPEVVAKIPHPWPEGVRRYSYRKKPELPFGSAPKFDNVQIAFNVVPFDQKEDMTAFPPGTMRGFIPAKDTDYEYALNPVAEAYGGGTEVWRSSVPGMPRKNFYPRQPASPYDGPVKDARLAIRRDGNTRIVECALPWGEIPLVRKALDEGKPIKFTFRVNDDKGPAMELAEDRSASKKNPYAFHPEWVEHWANEIEFAFEK